MIQFNLLPDVKLEYMKAKRLKRLLTAISLLVGSASLAIALGLFFLVGIVQKETITDLNNDIKKAADTVQSTPNLNRILTVQNQLVSLSTVHNTKPAVTRLFDYLGRTTPLDVTLANTKLDLVGYTVSFTGQATDLLSINRYVDILKFTTFIEADEEGNFDAQAEAKPAFSQVVLGGFAVDKEASTFQITAVYSPEIFDNQKDIQLLVPKGISTRSQQKFQQQSPALFKENPRVEKEASNE